MAIKIQLDYDDDVLEIIDKMNEAFEIYNLKFEDDNEAHDGFIILSLEEKA